MTEEQTPEQAIGAWLEQIKESGDMTYQQLAQRFERHIKVHGSALQKVVQGDRRITVNEFAKYAQAFNMAPGRLLDVIIGGTYDATPGEPARAAEFAVTALDGIYLQLRKAQDLTDEATRVLSQTFAETNQAALDVAKAQARIIDLLDNASADHEETTGPNSDEVPTRE